MRWLHWWHCVSFCSLFKPKANICIVTMLRSSFPLPLIRLLERILLILCAVDFNDFISQPAERWFKPIIRINNRFSCFRCYNMIWNRTFQLWNSQCQNHLDSINFGSFLGQFIKSIQKKNLFLMIILINYEKVRHFCASVSWLQNHLERDELCMKLA